MAIDDISRRVVYLGDGSKKVFSFSFTVFDAEDVAVYLGNADDTTIEEEQLGYGTDYSVDVSAGTVTLVTAPAAGKKIAIVSEEDYDQPMTLTPYGGFNPETLNDNADRQCIQIQQLYEKSQRAITIPITSSETSEEILNHIFLAETESLKVIDHLDQIDINAAHIDNIDAVAPHVANIDTVVGSIANVNTVAKDISNVNVVATDKTNIDTVAANKTNIDAVVANKSNIDTVSSNISYVSTVANKASSVVTVANKIGNVNTVASNIDSVNTTAQHADNIDYVAEHIEDLPRVAQIVAYTLTSDSSAGDSFTVPTHKVGDSRLLVYIDGLLCLAGSGNQYVDSSTTTISINDAYPSGTEIKIVYV